jgi:hypothetical protein
VLNNPDITCSMCMFSDARKLKRDALLPGTLGCDKDRYIINVEAELIEGYSWANKLLTAS